MQEREGILSPPKWHISHQTPAHETCSFIIHTSNRERVNRSPWSSISCRFIRTPLFPLIFFHAFEPQGLGEEGGWKGYAVEKASSHYFCVINIFLLLTAVIFRNTHLHFPHQNGHNSSSLVFLVHAIAENHQFIEKGYFSGKLTLLLPRIIRGIEVPSSGWYIFNGVAEKQLKLICFITFVAEDIRKSLYLFFSPFYFTFTVDLLFNF